MNNLLFFDIIKMVNDMKDELMRLEKKLKETPTKEVKEQLIRALDNVCFLYEDDNPTAFFGMCIRKKELAKEIYEEIENDDYRYLYARTILDVAICLLNQNKTAEAEIEIEKAYSLLVNSDEDEESYFDNNMNLDNDFLSLLIDCCDTYGSILEQSDKLVPAFNVYMKKYVACLDYQDNSEEDIIEEINKTITTQLLPLLEQIENYEFSMEICEAYFDFNEKDYSKKNEDFNYVLEYYKKCCKKLKNKEALIAVKKRFK